MKPIIFSLFVLFCFPGSASATFWSNFQPPEGEPETAEMSASYYGGIAGFFDTLRQLELEGRDAGTPQFSEAEAALERVYDQLFDYGKAFAASGDPIVVIEDNIMTDAEEIILSALYFQRRGANLSGFVLPNSTELVAKLDSEIAKKSNLLFMVAICTEFTLRSMRSFVHERRDPQRLNQIYTDISQLSRMGTGLSVVFQSSDAR